jgi:signal peptidase II
VTLSVLITDQVTKLLVRGIRLPSWGIQLGGVQLHSSKNILGDFLTLTYVQNPGMAFGFEFGWRSIFAILSTVGSVAVFIYLFVARKANRLMRIALALVLGGSLGNWVDRVFYGTLFDGTSLFQGRVVDFIGVNLHPFPFIFNVADASLTIGIVLLCFSYWTIGKEADFMNDVGGTSISTTERENADNSKS